MKAHYILLFFISLFFLTDSGFSQKKYKRMRAEDSFSGIKSDTNKIVKVIIIHGTGCKTPRYSYNLMKNLSEELKITEDHGYTISKAMYYYYSDKPDTISFEVREFVPSDATKKEFHFYSIHWSKVTASQKLDLLNEDRPGKGVTRSWLSKFVKEKVLIEQLADFLLYNNDSIKMHLAKGAQVFVRRLLFLDNPTDYKYLSKSLLIDNIIPDTSNDVFSPQVKLSVNTSRMNVITGSLASSILYDIYLKPDTTKAIDEWSKYLYRNLNDTLDHISFRKNYYRNKLGKSQSEIDKYSDTVQIKYVFANKSIVHYALTNQFNLIGLQKESYLSITDPDDFIFNNLELIAFGDPSDVLSYYVPPYRFESSDGNIQVTNVSFKVKGFFQRFDKAHTKSFHKRKLHEKIANGFILNEEAKDKEIRGCVGFKSNKCKKRETKKIKKRLPCNCWEEQYY